MLGNNFINTIPFDVSPLRANVWVEKNEIDMSCDCVCCVSGQSSGSSCFSCSCFYSSSCCYCCCYSCCLRYLPLAAFISGSPSPVHFNSKSLSFCNSLLYLRTSWEHFCFDALNVLLDALWYWGSILNTPCLVCLLSF